MAELFFFLALVSFVIMLFSGSNHGLFEAMLILFVISLFTFLGFSAAHAKKETIRIDSTSFTKSVTKGETIYTSHNKEITVIIEGEKR